MAAVNNPLGTENTLIKDTHPRLLWLWFLVIVIAGAVFVWAERDILMPYIGLAPKQSDTHPLTDAAMRVLKGDYAGVIQEGQNGTRASSVILEASKFASGSTEDRIAAIRSAKDDYFKASSGYVKSLAINRLADYAEVSTAFPELFKEIFSGEPFASLQVSKSKGGSIKNLAEFSLSFSSTTPALLRAAEWEATRLIMQHDGDASLSESELNASVSNTLALLAKADDSFAREQSDIGQSLFADSYIQNFYAKEGMVYGAIALVRPEYLAKSSDALQEAIAVYTGEAGKGNDYPILEARLPSMYLHRAAFTDAIAGESVRSAVLADIAQAVALLKNHPERHQYYFTANLRSLAGNTTARGLWLDHKRLEHLASLDPSLKELLNSLGWKL